MQSLVAAIDPNAYTISAPFNIDSHNSQYQQDIRTLENSKQSEYWSMNPGVYNHSAVDVATSQPGVMFRTPFGGCGLNGTHIDVNTMLRNGACDTLNAPMYTNTRPFITVPYLGRGAVDPVLESMILFGKRDTDRRSVTHVPEKRNPYMRPSVYNNDVQQYYKYKMETMGHPEATVLRGGVDTRGMTRDNGN